MNWIDHAVSFCHFHVSCSKTFLCWIQMGTNYKAALIPQRIRETIHGWGKEARKKRRHSMFTDDSTMHTDTSTVLSIEEDDNRSVDAFGAATESTMETVLELQPVMGTTPLSTVANETSSRAATPLLRPSASVSSSTPFSFRMGAILRSSSMPRARNGRWKVDMSRTRMGKDRN